MGQPWRASGLPCACCCTDVRTASRVPSNALRVVAAGGTALIAARRYRHSSRDPYASRERRYVIETSKVHCI